MDVPVPCQHCGQRLGQYPCKLCGKIICMDCMTVGGLCKGCLNRQTEGKNNTQSTVGYRKNRQEKPNY
ncbi:MAG: hypothetical protein GF334_12120 [Candidatus Altiarchaeales archaeon]|nr:hypothetical protein [Candidatus Altiarchaeales archaeon]